MKTTINLGNKDSALLKDLIQLMTDLELWDLIQQHDEHQKFGADEIEHIKKIFNVE